MSTVIFVFRKTEHFYNKLKFMLARVLDAAKLYIVRVTKGVYQMILGSMLGPQWGPNYQYYKLVLAD